MPDLYLVMNHRLTTAQEADARASLGVRNILDLPPLLRELWRQIPADVPELVPVLQPIFRWMEQTGKPSDYVLVQGDFGACFLTVRFAFGKGMVPVYSTTRREMSEVPALDGSVETRHRIRHVAYRRYGL